MRKILAFITFLLFLILLWYSYNKYHDCCNNSNAKEVKNTSVTTKETDATKKATTNQDGSLLFNWNSDVAIENEYWNNKKLTILSGFTDGKILKIEGPYFKEENKEIGFKRAKAAYNKLADKINLNKVEFGSRLIDYYEAAKTEPFSGTAYLWLVRNDNITEIDNKALIYFPSNSTKKISNTNVKTYLEDVVKSLKDNNNKMVYLSGHSDNRGNAVLNKKLALGRANSIKKELIRLGLSSNRISVISYGEEKPIASNNTKSGQQKNRRVELEIK